MQALLAVLDPAVDGVAALLGVGPIVESQGRREVAERAMALFGPGSRRTLVALPVEGGPGPGGVRGRPGGGGHQGRRARRPRPPPRGVRPPPARPVADSRPAPEPPADRAPGTLVRDRLRRTGARRRHASQERYRTGPRRGGTTVAARGPRSHRRRPPRPAPGGGGHALGGRARRRWPPGCSPPCGAPATGRRRPRWGPTSSIPGTTPSPAGGRPATSTPGCAAPTPWRRWPPGPRRAPTCWWSRA